ncbi:MAG: Inner membrane protein YbbJ [Holosporales bacterium]
MQNFHYWFLFSLLMVILETLLPVAIPLWAGVTGFIVGGFVYFLGLGGLSQAIVFCLLVAPITLLGRKLFPIHIENIHDQFMNQRVARLMGQEIILEKELNGVQTVQQKVGETIWPLKGEAMPVGTRVKIVDVDNNTLIVEKV